MKRWNLIGMILSLSAHRIEVVVGFITSPPPPPPLLSSPATVTATATASWKEQSCTRSWALASNREPHSLCSRRRRRRSATQLSFFSKNAAAEVKVSSEKVVLEEDKASIGSIAGNFNPLYGSLWAGLVAFAVFVAPGAMDSPADAEMIANYIADPMNSGMNQIFLLIFNLFAVIPVLLAAVIMPGASGRSVPVTPFLMASSAVGYFALGPYMTFRGEGKGEDGVLTKSDLGWFTSNVLENKILNYLTLAVALSLPFSAGFFSPDFQLGAAFEGYKELLSSSKFVSISTCDLSVLSLTCALLIPSDLKRRGFDNEQKAATIAAATMLLPVIGASFYCALRPALDDE